MFVNYEIYKTNLCVNAVGAGAAIVLDGRGRCLITGNLAVNVVQLTFAGR